MYCPDNEKKPSDFIRFLKEQFDEIKKQMLPSFEPVKYIDEFIYNIDFEISFIKGKTNKELILNNYDDIDYFSEKIQEKLDINVKRYLGMKIDDDDSDIDD